MPPAVSDVPYTQHLGTGSSLYCRQIKVDTVKKYIRNDASFFAMCGKHERDLRKDNATDAKLSPILTSVFDELQRWEVATNLLRPDIAGFLELTQVVEQWQAEQTLPIVIEKGYRVGTTAKQCLQALSLLDDSIEACQQHDTAVVERLKSYLANIQYDN
jgi:hypothetical protein